MLSKDFYQKEVSETINQLETKPIGLSSREAKRRLEQNGPNALPETRKNTAIKIFLRQFRSLLVYILILAAIVSFLSDHAVDGYIILAVIIANAVIGFFQEYRAEQAISALKNLIDLEAKVYRDGRIEKISSQNLVVGDVVLIEAGDKIPADARLIQAKKLAVIESMLTGESAAVNKNIETIANQVTLGEQTNMAWSGTLVTNGQGKAVITATGIDTQFGQIANQINQVKDEPSHFEEKISQLVRQIGIIGLVSSILIFITLFFLRGVKLFETLLFTLAALVASIPEGLPAILALTLAIGARRMAKRQAIIRKLSATETLGVVTIICTDKTGTLTENTMTAERLWLGENEEIEATGRGWSEEGEFLQDGQKINPLESSSAKRLLEIALMGNLAEIVHADGQTKIIGDPTEAALVALAHKASLRRTELESKLQVLDHLSFSSEQKFQAALVQDENGQKWLFVAGAPEVVLEKSVEVYDSDKIFPEFKKQASQKIFDYSSGGNRNLGLACKQVDNSLTEVNSQDVFDLEFVGLVAIRDPLRPEVKEAIEKAKEAGIRVLMLTGDHKATARSIAEEIGLIEPGGECLEESDLANLNDEGFLDKIKKVQVFARLAPKTKFRITQTLQKQGEIVAMTGDGVNDAPALKRADVGISMGRIGTDVARESAEIILVDDNFASIINAVEEGRTVFANVRKSTYYLIATNLAETITILGAMVLGLPLPLTASQILWLNLVTDGVNGLAIATEPANKKILRTKAKELKRDILNAYIAPLLIAINIAMVSASLFAFWYFLPDGLAAAQTAVFIVLSLSQLLNIFNIRSEYDSAINSRLFGNKFVNLAVLTSFGLMSAALLIEPLRNALALNLPNPDKILIMLALAAGVFTFVELSKWVLKRWRV